MPTIEELEAEVAEVRNDFACTMRILRHMRDRYDRFGPMIWAVPGDDHDDIVEFLLKHNLGFDISDFPDGPA